MTNPYIKEAKVEVKNEFKDATINSGEKTGLNATSNQSNSGILGNLLPNFSSANFLQGAVVGAIAAYVLTNENAQQAIFKSIVRMGKLFEAGKEELKERFEDAKAEIEAGQ